MFMSRNIIFMKRSKSRYYFAWKNLQSIVYGLNIVSDNNIYADEEKIESVSLKYSLHDICDLENLFNTLC